VNEDEALSLLIIYMAMWAHMQRALPKGADHGAIIFPGFCVHIRTVRL